MAASASGSRRQSQRSRKVSAGLVSPTTCFSWPSSSQTNNQSYLPLPSWFSYLPAFLVLLALSSHSSQTNNQTNNQRNKQTHKQETNTQTSAPRCSQKLTGAPRNPRYFQIIRDASRCYQVLPDARRCSKVLPDTPRCSKMLPQTPRYSQIHPDARETSRDGTWTILTRISS